MIVIAAFVVASLCVQTPRQRALVDSSVRKPDVAPIITAIGELRIHDLSALTGHDQLLDLIANIGPSTGARKIDRTQLDFEELEHTRDRVEKQTVYLTTTIRELISPPLIPESQLIAHLDRGRFALIASNDQHKWLEDFALAGSQFTDFIELRFTIFKFDPDRLKGFRQLESGSVLSDASTEELLGLLRKSGIESVSSPEIRSKPFQEAYLKVLNETAYVKDFEIKVIPGLEHEVVDPIIDTIRSGFTLQIRSVPLPNQQLNIFVNLELTDLDLPMNVMEYVVGEARQKLSIQLPQTTRSLVQGHYVVTSGETVVLKNTDLTDERALLVFLKTTRIPESQTLREE